jgi:tripartite-type tricarboxylate transporter receptor subunit TctC
MIRRNASIAASVTALAVVALCHAAPAAAQAKPFYEGKTITMMNNYPPGGPSDIEGRLFARYLPKYIPGNPSIVFKNMGGAGGLTAFNWLGEVAKPDGLTTCFYTWNPVIQLVEDPALRVPFHKFVFVAGVSSPIVAFIRKDVAPGIKEPKDFLKAHDFKIAGLSDVQLHDVRHRISLDLLLGPVYQNVTGFAGFAPMFKAIAQNEVQFSSSSIPGYQGTVVPTMVQPGIVVPVFQYETITPDGKFIRSPHVPDLPTWLELYQMKNGKDAMPKGVEWEALKLMNLLYSNMLRTVLLPPGSPKEAQKILSDAFAAVGKDPEFRAEYEKVVRAPPDMVTGPEGEKIINALGSVDPKVVVFLKEYVAKAQKR